MSESTAHTVKLYDRNASQAMFVFGGTPDGDGVSFRYENDATNEVRAVSAHALMAGECVALCDHGYTANDSCPGCDAADERILSLPGTLVHDPSYLGRIAAEFGGITRHAINPDGEIVARGCASFADAYRALVLDHKRRAWHTAINEARTRAEEAAERETFEVKSVRIGNLITGPADVWVRPLMMSAAEAFEVIDFSGPTPLDNAASRRDREIDEAVRLLVRYGIDTPARFSAHVERVLKADREAFVSDLLFDHHAALSRLRRTTPVVTDTNDGSAL